MYALFAGLFTEHGDHKKCMIFFFPFQTFNEMREIRFNVDNIYTENYLLV